MNKRVRRLLLGALLISVFTGCATGTAITAPPSPTPQDIPFICDGSQAWPCIATK